HAGVQVVGHRHVVGGHVVADPVVIIGAAAPVVVDAGHAGACDEVGGVVAGEDQHAVDVVVDHVILDHDLDVVPGRDPGGGVRAGDLGVAADLVPGGGLHVGVVIAVAREVDLRLVEGAGR